MPEEISTTVESSPPTPTRGKSFNLPKVILAIIVGFILLAVSAYGGYWYGKESAKLKVQNAEPQAEPRNQQVSQPTTLQIPSTTDTSDWQTYRNRKYGFEFRYPPTLSVQIDGANNEVSDQRSIVLVRLAKVGEPNHPIYNLSAIRSSLSIKDYIVKHLCSSQPEKFCTDIAEGVISSSLTVSTTPLVNFQAVDTVFERDDIIYDFSVASVLRGESIPEGALQLYWQILKTFRFESSEEKEEGISSWKTFTNPDWGISFRYPDFWYYEDSSEYGGASKGSTYSFFLVGTEADHSFADHSGNEVFIINGGDHASSFEETKSERSVEFTVDGRPAHRISMQKWAQIYIFTGPTDTRYLTLGVKEQALPYLDQILSTFKFLD